jgi:hypothetical protein
VIISEQHITGSDLLIKKLTLAGLAWKTKASFQLQLPVIIS